MNQSNKKSNRRKLHILDNAVIEFAKNGLKGTSVNTIAHKSGLSKAQLYYYFSNKKNLYEQTLIHMIHIWQDLFKIENTYDNPEDFLRAYIKRIMRLSFEHPEIAQLYFNEIVQGAPFLKKHWHLSKTQFDIGVKKIKGWIERGLMDPVDPWLLQLNIWGVTQFYGLNAAKVRFLIDSDEKSRLNFEHFSKEVTNLILKGCGVKSLQIVRN